MSDVLLGNYDNSANFDKLCGNTTYGGIHIDKGCAMLVVELDGADEKDITEYYFQPNAIANQFNNAAALTKLGQKSPTRLIQDYYSCVLAPWPSFFAATGLAYSNASLYSLVVFIVFVFIIFNYLNKIERRKIMSRAQKVL